MELCFLNWVEVGGKVYNGVFVKMNENKGRWGLVCCVVIRVIGFRISDLGVGVVVS